MGHNCKGNMDRFCVIKKHASLNDLNNSIELDGYYIAIIVRNPYERVMSNFIRRFIRHDKMKEEIVFKQLEKYMNKPISLPEIPFWLGKLLLPFSRMYAKVSGQKTEFTAEALDILRFGPRLVCSDKAKRELNYHCRDLSESLTDVLKG